MFLRRRAYQGQSRRPHSHEVHARSILRRSAIEKHALLEQLLGVKVPREIIRAVNPRNYEAADFAVRQLPAEKQQQLVQLHSYGHANASSRYQWQREHLQRRFNGPHCVRRHDLFLE